ncbi:sensor histidine kinase KdpD [Bacteriovorax sp. DB6_IX]|uniref:sensor histidine kinase n=1 Tax=Bacteriovorax sp. DB6_IX TaxID=1353530 RepID=UPI00038A43ED|nr:HAMP domain-containing sensor histidine kinase [Bacteriovorax sp. DB6_IX]EQC43182.1 GHKL domain protein [Bacteriovorax sp. DB6_IX]
MEIKKSNSILFILSGLVGVLITLLGAWWLYLLFALSNKLSALEVQSSGPNIARLIKWEGTAFIILLFIIIISHTILFFKDQKKNKAIHAFFAGLTHELKTPLASIRLQAEVIKDEADRIENSRLDKLTNRLIDDTGRLETQMDKILQLSRIERGGNLNLVAIPIASLFERELKSFSQDLEYQLENIDSSTELMADEFALELIVKNLIHNTKNHTKSKKIHIKGSKQEKSFKITYRDFGAFEGNIAKLGNLFYKHNSSKGSGIGLYLSKKLIKRMNGQFSIKQEDSAGSGLIFEITLPLAKGADHD